MQLTIEILFVITFSFLPHRDVCFKLPYRRGPVYQSILPLACSLYYITCFPIIVESCARGEPIGPCLPIKYQYFYYLES